MLPYLLRLLALVCLITSTASAGIAFEFYPADRPAEADLMVPRILDELEDSGLFIARRQKLREVLGWRAAASGIRDRSLTGQDLLAEINIGLKAHYDLRNDQAIGQFVAAIEKGHANPAILVSSATYRDAMLDAQVALATSYHRRNRGDDRQRSIEVMQEVIRSFPDRMATLRQTHGPEPDGIYKTALKALQARGTGSLVVDVDDPNVLIFVDENDKPANATFQAKLPPGRYRVLVKHPTTSGRVFEVEVRPNDTAKLSIDWKLAAAVTLTEKWLGFSGTTEAQALAFARQLVGERQAAIVLITIQPYKGVPAVRATLYRTADAKPVRTYLATLDGSVGMKAAALAAAMRGTEKSSPLLIQLAQGSGPNAPIPSETTPEPSPVTPSRPINRWYVAAGVTAATTLLGSGLAIKLALDGRAAGDELDRTCAVSCTSQQAKGLLDKQDFYNHRAILWGVVGGVSLVASVVFVVIGRGHKPTSSLAIVPTRDGGEVAYLWTF